MADHHQGIMCEVEIQQDGQECCVEIESVPIDMPEEAMEPMLGGLEGRDIILEPQEEIVGGESSDPLDLYDVPIPDHSDIYAEQPGPSIKKKKPHHQHYGYKRNIGGIPGVVIKNEPMLYEAPLVEAKPRKWEQKQVQIKTMEGEFSVTMWASGTSDGTNLCF